MSSKSYKSLDPKKSLGQNFLTDPWWIQRIVSAFGLEPQDTVLEIGPGKGVLTAELLKVSGRLLAVEIDQRMVEHLGERFAGATNLEIVHQDFLRFPLGETLAGVPVRIIGNLPYHITSGIIGRVLDEIRAGQADPQAHARITSFDIMIQKEVGERICSTHGTKVYGVLSVLAWLLCDVRVLLDVPPKAFYGDEAAGAVRIRELQDEAEVGVAVREVGAEEDDEPPLPLDDGGGVLPLEQEPALPGHGRGAAALGDGGAGGGRQRDEEQGGEEDGAAGDRVGHARNPTAPPRRP